MKARASRGHTQGAREEKRREMKAGKVRHRVARKQ